MAKRCPICGSEMVYDKLTFRLICLKCGYTEVRIPSDRKWVWDELE